MVDQQWDELADLMIPISQDAEPFLDCFVIALRLKREKALQIIECLGSLRDLRTDAIAEDTSCEGPEFHLGEIAIASVALRIDPFDRAHAPQELKGLPRSSPAHVKRSKDAFQWDGSKRDEK